MEFKAFKMDGLGNDFVIIDKRSNKIDLSKDQILKICDRSFIGCDQLIYITESEKGDAGMEFYNSDGSTSGACGNGTRCVAYLLSKEKTKYGTKIYQEVLKHQKEHAKLIKNFGRFPKRNKILNRKSTKKELKYIKNSNQSLPY